MQQKGDSQLPCLTIVAYFKNTKYFALCSRFENYYIFGFAKIKIEFMSKKLGIEFLDISWIENP